ncbi:MAG: hypothetical protein Q9164_001796 [Protoblastenia rupestris]
MVLIAFYASWSCDYWLEASELHARDLGTARSIRFRPFTAFATSDPAYDTRGSDACITVPSLRVKIDALVRSTNRKRADAWAELLEFYLPRRLRYARDDQQKDGVPETIQEIITLPALLRRARSATDVDILGYLVVQQGRWEAVIWLVEALLDRCRTYKEENESSRQVPVPLWSGQEWSLNDLTVNPINVELPQPSLLSLDNLLAWDISQGEKKASSFERQGLGEIWQSLGCMILSAEDRSTEDPGYQAIMSLVLDVLSQIHHINALPPTIYNYAAAKDKSVVQRPPTLYLLSARIMTMLSDVAWKKHWISEMALAKEYGYNLPPARVQPKLLHVGTEVWLELVLWTCVEGGWITEAAWIVSEMERRKSDKALQWSVISWDDICKRKAPDLDWTAILKLQIDKARLNQSTGIGIANSGTQEVDMGPRTISREVILAIIDGLVNRSSTKADIYGDRVVDVQRYIKNCKNLLERHHSRLGNDHLNAVLLRTIETAVLQDQSFSGALSRILDLYTETIRDPDSILESDFQTQETGLDLSAARLGLLHRILFYYSDSGNFQGSLQTLRDIQNIVDANRNLYIQEFADELRDRLRQGHEDSSLAENFQTLSSPMLYPRIPVHVLARLLDFVADNKFADLGQWLMHNEDIDGGIIEAHMYDEPNLQPALLRFATATADNELLTRVLERLQPPLSGFILHPLLRCQVVTNKWNAVENILGHFRDTPELSWSPIDTMALAAAILKTLHSPQRSIHLNRAFGILKDVLQGRYDPAQSPSRLFDPSYIQKANQLKRILRSVPEGSFHNIASDSAREAGRFSNLVPISARAFNILLDAIVEQFGCAAGRILWQRWCLDPEETTPRANYFSAGRDSRDEKVVTPTIYMLRTIVRPLAQKLRQHRASSSNGEANATMKDAADMNAPIPTSISEEDQSLVSWAIPLYQKFGMDRKAINRELPGAIYVRKDRKPP